MSTATVSHCGVKINYRELDNRWVYNLDGKSVSSPTLSLAKEEIEKEHQPLKSTYDYRDDLIQLLDNLRDEKGLTRYRVCKMMDIDSGTLSNVLAKRRHFSLEKLEQILVILNCRMKFEAIA